MFRIAVSYEREDRKKLLRIKGKTMNKSFGEKENLNFRHLLAYISKDISLLITNVLDKGNFISLRISFINSCFMEQGAFA